MTNELTFEALLETWQRRKRACDELTNRYLWSTATTPVMPIPELQTSLTRAVLDDIEASRQEEREAWSALADYLGRHDNPKADSR